MASDLVPLLWLCGTSGAGKSTVAWELFRGGASDGTPTAYVDIDQLGMCYPAPPDDESRDRLKARNLGVVVGNFCAAGAERILVSGVLDPAAADLYSRALAGVSVTWCQLNAAADTLTERLALRGWPTETIEFCLDYAARLEESDLAHVVVNTERLSVAEVVDQVARTALHTNGGLDCPESRAGTEAPAAQLRAVLIMGDRVVGKSTVAWEVYNRTLAAGMTTAFLDLRQLSFFAPPPNADPSNEKLKVQNVTALSPNFSAAGAHRLILNGEVDRPRDFAAVFPRGGLATYVLTARAQTLRDRRASRARGGGPALIGDELPSEEELGRELPTTGTGFATVDTTELTVDETAKYVIENTEAWVRAD